MILKGMCWWEEEICLGDLGEAARFAWIHSRFAAQSKHRWGLKSPWKIWPTGWASHQLLPLALISYFWSNLQLYLVTIPKGPKIPIQLRPFRSLWSKRQLISSRWGFPNSQYYPNKKILKWYSVWWSRYFQRNTLLFCQGHLPPVYTSFPHFIFPFTCVLSINLFWWSPPGGTKSTDTWMSKTDLSMCFVRVRHSPFPLGHVLHCSQTHYCTQISEIISYLFSSGELPRLMPMAEETRSSFMNLPHS